MAHEAQTFLKLLFLKYSTCLTFQLASCSELKSRRKQDPCLSCTVTTVYISQNRGWRKLVRQAETLRLSMWGEKELSPHTSVSRSCFGGNRTRCFSAGWSGAGEGHCSSCRGTDSVEWIHEAAKCCGTGTVQPCCCHTEAEGSIPPLIYAGKRGLVRMSWDTDTHMS